MQRIARRSEFRVIPFRLHPKIDPHRRSGVLDRMGADLSELVAAAEAWQRARSELARSARMFRG